MDALHNGSEQITLVHLSVSLNTVCKDPPCISKSDLTNGILILFASEFMKLTALLLDRWKTFLLGLGSRYFSPLSVIIIFTF